MLPAENIEFDPSTNVLTILPFDGVEYIIGGKVVSGEILLTRKTTVRARSRGRLFDEGAEKEWTFDVSQVEEPEVEQPLTPEVPSGIELGTDTSSYNFDSNN